MQQGDILKEHISARILVGQHPKGSPKKIRANIAIQQFPGATAVSQYTQRKNQYNNLIGLLLACILPFAIVVYQLIAEVDSRIEFSYYEMSGNTYLQHIEQLFYDLSKGYRLGYEIDEARSKQEPLADRWLAIPEKLNQDVEALVSVQEKYGTLFQISWQFDDFYQTWQRYERSLQTLINTPANSDLAQSITAQDLEPYYDRLKEHLRDLMTQVGNYSNLILDPDLDSYYLMDAILLRIPDLQQLMFEMQRLVLQQSASQPFSAAQRERISIWSGLLEEDLSTLQNNLSIAFSHQASGHARARLLDPLQTFTQSLTELKQLMVSQANPITASPRAIATLPIIIDQCFDTSYHLWQGISVELDQELSDRIRPFRQKTLIVKVFAVLVSLVLVYAFIMFAISLNDQKRGALRLITQYKTAQILAEATETEIAVPDVLQTVCETLGWGIGELWQVNQENSTLDSTALWHSDIFPAEVMSGANWRLSFPMGEGLPGKTYEKREPVWIADICKDELFARSSVIKQLGLRSACSFPIIVDGIVIGVLILFGDRSRQPSADTYNVLQAVANQIGQFIKTRQSEAALRQTEALQRMALNATRMGVWDWDIINGKETWSPEVEQIFGLPSGAYTGSYQDFLELIHPEDRQNLIDAQDRTFRDNVEYRSEYRVRWPDGSEHWLTSRGGLIRDEDGHPQKLTGIVMDITDRKQAELALAQSEQRLRDAEEKYRSIFENAVMGIFQTTPDGCYLNVNPALADIYGYNSPQEMISSLTNIGHQLYLDPKRRQTFVQMMDEQGKVSEFESEVRRRDGKIIWISENAIAVRDESGKILYYEGMVENITERKQGQAALRESERRFRTLLNNIPGAFYRCAYDAQWTMSFLSDAIENICGYPASDFIQGKTYTFNSIMHPEDIEYAERSVADAILLRQPYMLEYRIRHANGTTRWVYEKGQAIFDDQDKLMHLDGVIFDITERKASEEFLDRQTEILEAIATSADLHQILSLLIETIEVRSPRPVMGSVLLSSEDGTCLRAAVSSKHLPASCSAALDGTPIGEGIASCGTAAYRREPVIVSNIATDPLWENFRDFASEYGLQACWSIPILSVQNKILGTFALHHRQPASPTNSDWQLMETAAHLAGIAIERDQTEQELRQAKETAEASSRAKSQFLANMSHELRTPLNAIIGYSEMLQEDATDFGYSDIIPDLEKIRNAGKHLLELINDILDISKIEAGRMELHLESFDLAGLVQDVQTTIHPLVEKNNNTFVVNLAQASGKMYADLTKVRQMLFNLLSNAAKFTEQGTITLTVVRSPQTPDIPSLRDRPGQDWIQFEVSDTGIGMTETQLQRVFEAFIQADASTTRKYGGTGLGLAISQRFCQMMGGEIVVASQPGQGSTFTIWLPGQVIDSPLPPLPTAAPVRSLLPPSKQPTVLMIDDDAAVHDLMTRYLSNSGFRLEVTSDGSEGIKRARALKPDVIILDVLLPHMNGWDVLAILKADPVLADVPVILMTIVDEQNRGFTLGASDYLTKPIDYKRLLALLQKYRAVSAESDRPGRVLVVEDDEATRQMFQRILEREGWQVVTADNGRVGLEQVQTASPDLVLLDLMMPEMDGFQFLDALRKQGKPLDVPVVVITAMDLTPAERAQLNGYVEQILQKGAYSREELLTEVHHLVLNYLQPVASP